MFTSDQQLLRRLRANDRAAFEAVVKQHYQPLYRQLWHLCGDRDAAADLTQETFVQAWGSLPTFAGRSSFSTWLHAIAVRVWRRWHERQGRLSLVALDALEETLPDTSSAFADLAERDFLRERLHCALHQLPPEYREPLVLFYGQGCKYREIAEILEIPLGTVKSRLHAGLARLRAVLKAVPGDPPP